MLNQNTASLFFIKTYYKIKIKIKHSKKNLDSAVQYCFSDKVSNSGFILCFDQNCTPFCVISQLSTIVDPPDLVLVPHPVCQCTLEILVSTTFNLCLMSGYSFPSCWLSTGLFHTTSNLSTQLALPTHTGLGEGCTSCTPNRYPRIT